MLNDNETECAERMKRAVNSGDKKSASPEGGALGMDRCVRD